MALHAAAEAEALGNKYHRALDHLHCFCFRAANGIDIELCLRITAGITTLTFLINDYRVRSMPNHFVSLHSLGTA